MIVYIAEAIVIYATIGSVIAWAWAVLGLLYELIRGHDV